MVAYSGSRVRGSHSVATWRVPRSRGALSGLLLVLLGAWGGLVPFIGPHFGYAYTPDATWTMTWGRLWLDVVPGVVALLSGLVLLISASRVAGLWAGWLAAMAGAWFAVGPILSRLWSGGQSQAGTPVATDTLHSVVIEIGFYTGLGVVIVFLAAAALGRFSVVGVRDAKVAEAAMAADTAVAPDAETVPPALAEQETTTLPVQEHREPQHEERIEAANREQRTAAVRERRETRRERRHAEREDEQTETTGTDEV